MNSSNPTTPTQASSWRVKVQDFQSIKSADIEISDGITLITGPTNNGKTAILRAIESAIFNTGADSQVRSGKKIFGVSISNGAHTMTYCRKSEGSSEKSAYKIDSLPPIRKVGRTQLPEVRDLFGITDVKIKDGFKVKLNFWSQGDKPFLTDKTSGQLFEFLSLTSAESYHRVLKRMAADLKTQEAEISKSGTVIDTYKKLTTTKKEFLKKQEGFQQVYERTVDLTQKNEDLQNLTHILTSLTSLTHTITDTTNALTSLTPTLTSIAHTITITQNHLNEYQSLNTTLSHQFSIARSLKLTSDDIKKTEQSLSHTTDTLDHTTTLLQSVEPKIRNLTSLTHTITQTTTRLQSLNTLNHTITHTTTHIQSLDDTIQSYHNEILTLQDLIDRATQTTQKIHQLSTIHQSHTTLLTQLNHTRQAVTEEENTLTQLTQQILTSDQNLTQLKSLAGFCPFCGTVFVTPHNHTAHTEEGDNDNDD